jgi:hypothetical protein
MKQRSRTWVLKIVVDVREAVTYQQALALPIESRIHCHCPFFARKWRHDESNTSRTAKHRMQKTWRESGAHLDKVATTKPVNSGGCARQALRLGPKAMTRIAQFALLRLLK